MNAKRPQRRCQDLPVACLVSCCQKQTDPHSHQIGKQEDQNSIDPDHQKSSALLYRHSHVKINFLSAVKVGKPLDPGDHCNGHRKAHQDEGGSHHILYIFQKPALQNAFCRRSVFCLDPVKVCLCLLDHQRNTDRIGKHKA